MNLMDPEPSDYLQAQAWLVKARQNERPKERASDELAHSPKKASLNIVQSIPSSSSSPRRPLIRSSPSQRSSRGSPFPPSSPSRTSPSSPYSQECRKPSDIRSKYESIPRQDYSSKLSCQQDGIMSADLEPDETVHLSEEQKYILEMVKNGKNVFFTGPAGTGKSVVLRNIISWARTFGKGTKDTVAITAPTGIAAVNIGGRSVHSWAGIELGKESAEILAKRISGSKAKSQRWTKVKILIIDEISMLDGNLFDKLDYIARRVRDDDRPFGGIQLVLTGDFFQLPPVPDKSYRYEMAATFAFQAKAWSDCISRPLFLKNIFRQTDNTFIEILSAIREGRVTDEHIAILQTLDRTIVYPDGIQATQLFPLRKDVKGCNSKKLAALLGDAVQYKAIDTGGFDVKGDRIPYQETQKLVERLVALETVSLKVGAQVMLIQNTSEGKLVNGSTGIVTQFLTVREAVAHHIRIAGINPNDKKFQGSEEDTVIEVAKKLKLVESDVHFRAHVQFSNFSVEQRWPLVHFTNGMDLLCAPVSFTVVGVKGNVEATRYQVPLILAWAISIHKSQGQTLPRVKIDLEHIFEKGQAYVALSRATSMDGLEIRNLNPGKIQVHPSVLKWQQFWTSLGEFDAEFMDSELESFFEPTSDDDLM